MTPPAPHPTVAPLLAGIAGFVDTASFVALHGLFAAHVTGNFVLLGAALALGTGGILAKLVTFPVFVLGVAGARLLSRRFAAPARPLLAVQTALLACFALCGAVLGPFADADSPALILTAAFAVAAMGVQNALMRLALPSAAPTTIMTGNTTAAVLDVMDRIAGTLPPEGVARLHRLGLVLAGFAIGCTAGAIGMLALGFAALALPLVATAMLLATVR